MTTAGPKAAAFRAIAQARRSAKRFQRDRIVPKDVLQDILESTIVSWRLIGCCYYF